MLFEVKNFWWSYEEWILGRALKPAANGVGGKMDVSLIESETLKLPSEDDNPLRVTLMFSDGSVFTYYEQRDSITDQTCTGFWRSPLPNPSFAYGVAETFRQGPLRVMVAELGDIVAVASQPREGVMDIACEKCGGSGCADVNTPCERCDGDGRQPWPTG